MSLTPVTPFLAVALILSVTGMVYGAGLGDAHFTRLCAQAFILTVVAASFLINCVAWTKKDPEQKKSTTASALRRNARLAALIYTWGGAAMFAMYSLADLSWRHSWQYGLGMAVIAIGIFIYLYRLSLAEPTPAPPMYLTILHGAAAIGGLAYLIGSGKLQTVKSDWAANEVFLWGGLGIVLLCALSLITHLVHHRRKREAKSAS